MTLTICPLCRTNWHSPFAFSPPLAASAEAQGGVELEEGAGVDGEDVAALAHMH